MTFVAYAPKNSASRLNPVAYGVFLWKWGGYRCVFNREPPNLMEYSYSLFGTFFRSYPINTHRRRPIKWPADFNERINLFRIFDGLSVFQIIDHRFVITDHEKQSGIWSVSFTFKKSMKFSKNLMEFGKNLCINW